VNASGSDSGTRRGVTKRVANHAIDFLFILKINLHQHVESGDAECIKVSKGNTLEE